MMDLMPLETVPEWLPEEAPSLEAYDGIISWLSREASRREFTQAAMSAERRFRIRWQAQGHQMTCRHTISSAESLLQKQVEHCSYA